MSATDKIGNGNRQSVCRFCRPLLSDFLFSDKVGVTLAGSRQLCRICENHPQNEKSPDKNSCPDCRSPTKLRKAPSSPLTNQKKTAQLPPASPKKLKKSRMRSMTVNDGDSNFGRGMFTRTGALPWDPLSATLQPAPDVYCRAAPNFSRQSGGTSPRQTRESFWSSHVCTPPLL